MYYLIPPRCANRPSNVLWECKKALYGTPDAAKDWFHKLADVMSQIGLKKTIEDQATFVGTQGGHGAEEWVQESTVNRVTGKRLEKYAHALERAPRNELFLYRPPSIHQSSCDALAAAHVDDVFYTGDDQFIRVRLPMLKKLIRIGSEDKIPSGETGSIEFTSITWRKLSEDQAEIVQPSLKTDRQLWSGPTDQWSTDAKKYVRGMASAINFLAERSRPDLSICGPLLMSRTSQPTPTEAIADAEKAYERLESNLGLPVAWNIAPFRGQIWRIVAVGDAAWNPHDTLQPNFIGYLIMIAPDLKRHTDELDEWRVLPIAWKTQKLKIRATSSQQAESIAACKALSAARYVQAMLTHVMGQRACDTPVDLVTDCSDVFFATTSMSAISDPEVRLPVGVLRDSWQCGALRSIRHIISNDNLADPLTKMESPNLPALAGYYGSRHLEIQERKPEALHEVDWMSSFSDEPWPSRSRFGLRSG